MEPLYVYTLFDKHKKPRFTGIRDGNKIIILDLYKGKGSKNPLAVVYANLKKINKLFAQNKRPIVTSGFKDYIRPFKLELGTNKLNIYDIHLPHIKAPTVDDKCKSIINKVLTTMPAMSLAEYQKLISNSAVVYDYLETKGLRIGCDVRYPQWSMETFSGRSKTLGVNIQGWSFDDIIRPLGFGDEDVLIHFDWICADIRAASILSDDKVLQDTFKTSDPYYKMMDIINADNKDNLTREECKIYLLKSINSMDITSVPLVDIYKDLGNWIRDCRCRAQVGCLETLLGRKFRLALAKNELAVLNGVMQGSVAHGMQHVVRRVWEVYPTRIVAEIHDSLVVASSRDSKEIKSVVDAVANIMMYPFAGVMDSNPAFPLKVSIGCKWKRWNLYATYRENGVEYAKRSV